MNSVSLEESSCAFWHDTHGGEASAGNTLPKSKGKTRGKTGSMMDRLRVVGMSVRCHLILHRFFASVIGADLLLRQLLRHCLSTGAAVVFCSPL
jgi:hypothetical protein